MAGYKPVKVTGYETGLVQSREEFLLPADAYPTLENMYIWRERIKRKQGCRLLGRLRRLLVGQFSGISVGPVFTFNVYSDIASPIVGEPDAQLELGSVVVAIGLTLFIDQGDGNLLTNPVDPLNYGFVNYSTGTININNNLGPQITAVTFNYFPDLPVMGICNRELDSINNEETVIFDTKYAYRFSGGFQEFITGTTWTGTDYNFFWSTNYWVNSSNRKLFWVTNFSTNDPIRYTDGSTWTDFAPVINSSSDVLAKSLMILPFRSRLLALNTYEGSSFGTAIPYPQRIRWAAIGNPLTANAWRDDIRGQGGYLDIPTSENIVSAGFVRDNLVIYCERSTWQLRYTGRSIAPFQIEKVNTELGTESTFSAVQFDTSLVGVGDKGIVECDSFQSNRIDIKIPDLVYQFSNQDFEYSRVHGIRDLQLRLVYWSYPYAPDSGVSNKFPDRRLVYNYENDSWSIFVDSFTCFGNYQNTTSYQWQDFSEIKPENTWVQQNFPWINRPALFPNIIGGNQQGFIEYLGNNLDSGVSNDDTLFIKNISGNDTTPTVIESPNHNLTSSSSQDVVSGQIIEISNIVGGNFISLNDGIFGINVLNANEFQIFRYDSQTGQFSTPQLNPSIEVYVGGGVISIRDNFNIVSKKFNFVDQGESIQIGYVDLLMNSTPTGAITFNMFLDYDNNSISNTYPENIISTSLLADTFFNSVVPTSKSELSGITSSKYWHRVYCPTRADFLTIQLTLSNAQLNGIEQESDVQIDAQIIWMRNAGRMNPL